MKQTELIMGMPITVEIIETGADGQMKKVFDYFKDVDQQFSTYKSGSEISRINKGLPAGKWSSTMKTVLALCEQTKHETKGYFDISHGGAIDPSGLVKGWAIHNAAKMLHQGHLEHFYIEGGGDVQASGCNEKHEPWSVGIRSPFNSSEVIKTLRISTEGVATSGTYVRGQHIYNPFQPEVPIGDIKSLTVVGPNIYEADRFATAAFAMGSTGIAFIESQPGLEGYMVNAEAMATYTSGFERYVVDV